MYVSVPINRYATPERLLGFYQAVEQGIAALPGVRVAAVGGNVPLDGSFMAQAFEIVGEPAPDRTNQPLARYQIVSARYFQALDISVLQGRAFTDQDTASTSQVCIVNEEFVRRYLKGRDAVGTRVSVPSVDLRGPKPVVREIVGVIRQVKEQRGEEQDAVEMYIPITQNPWYTASIVLQTAGNPMSFVSAVKAAIASVDKDQPVTRVRTMEDVAAESTSRPRFRAQLVAAFAALALALAAVGLFGVLAFAVHQRTREFGVRMALGARSGDVLRLVLTAGLRMTAIGVAIGLVAAVALTRFLAALLFGVTPLDPVTFLTVPAVLGVIALLACAAPALRAAHVDPAVALRQE
jgi:putative ABC transport system permease protein